MLRGVANKIHTKLSFTVLTHFQYSFCLKAGLFYNEMIQNGVPILNRGCFQASVFTNVL